MPIERHLDDVSHLPEQVTTRGIRIEAFRSKDRRDELLYGERRRLTQASPVIQRQTEAEVDTQRRQKPLDFRAGETCHFDSIGENTAQFKMRVYARGMRTSDRIRRPGADVRHLILSILICVVPLAAPAATITIFFAGAIDGPLSTFQPGPLFNVVNFGDPVYGTLTYDTAVPDTDPRPEIGQYTMTRPDLGFDFFLGGAHVRSDDSLPIELPSLSEFDPPIPAGTFSQGELTTATGQSPNISIHFNVTQWGIIPEPSTGLLLGLGLAGMARRRRP